MRNNEENTENIRPVRPPRGLFSRIIKRLGLEKELAVVRKHRGFFIGFFLIFSVLSVLAVVGLKSILSESSFGPYLSLIFSDPEIVITYWKSYLLSVFESMPGGMISVTFASVAFLLITARLTVTTMEKISEIRKSIKEQYHGNK